MKFFNSFLFSNSTATNIIYASLYVLLFAHVWKDYCVPIWSAYFYEDVGNSIIYNYLGYIIAVIPTIFYRGLKNVSSWISLILYYFGYVPIILGMLFNFKAENDYGIISYWIVLCVFMCLYFLADRIKVNLSLKKNQTWSLNYIIIFDFINVMLQLILYHNNIRFANFQEIYDLREENSQIGGGLYNYINAWSGTFTYPFFICYGLCKKNKLYIVLGSLLMFFSFCIFGLKAHLFAPLIILALYKFLCWQSNLNFNLMFVFTVSISFLSLFLMNNLENEICYMFAAVFLMRTLTISGCLFAGYYLPFFHDHSYTYFSHINIINFFFNSNPYAGREIGNVVSEGGMNANAIFWAMDGVAGGGVVGVFIVSVLFLGFLYLINALSSSTNRRFVCIIMVMPTIALLNVSFFTFILSEGVLLILLCLYKVKLDILYDSRC